ncbi:LPS export ABC transporter permease LptG [Rhodovibrionaceae bacterium A322]
MRTPQPLQPRGIRLSSTISAYIARQFAVWFVSLLGGVLGIIFLVSIVDLFDRLSTKDSVTLGLVLEMAGLRLPFYSQEIMPFMVLGAGMFTFWRLTRSNELVVARSAGVSVWQFLLPVIGTTLVIALLTIAIINPIGTTLLSRYNHLEARHMRNQESALTVAKAGIWLRQADEKGQSVIHAQRGDQQTMTLYDVIVFRFIGTDNFESRIDAETAQLHNGAWTLKDLWLTTPGEPPEFVESMEIKTELTPEKILDSFAPPESISFWSLPGFIELLENAGFSAQRHRLQFHKLLAMPALFGAMVLLAASFSMRNQRQGKVSFSILAGVLSAFLLYFLSNFVYALGLSEKVPVVLSAWAPSVVCLALGAATLLHLEDG